MTVNHAIWTRLITAALLVAGSSVCFSRTAAAQQATFTQAAAQANEMVVRVYPVADLVFTPPNYPYSETGTGTSNKGMLSPGMGGMGGGMGGMGGGRGMMGGGGFGGGIFEGGEDGDGDDGGGFGGVGGSLPTAIERLVRVVETAIAKESWSVNGGPGVITAYGDRLVISQTPGVHAQIQKLLNELRAAGAAQETITVRAWWLRLEPAQYRKLLDGMPEVSPPVVNREHLNQLAADYANDLGEVTCFDGQTVHVVSGEFRNVITSVTPVVGQLDSPMREPTSQRSLAESDPSASGPIVRTAVYRKESASGSSARFTPVQFTGGAGQGDEVGLNGMGGMGGGGAGSSVGYQPQTAKQHSGAMLEVTPRRIPQKDLVILDVRGIFNHWKDSDGVEFRGVVRLDQSTVVSQQLATTLKLPLGKPVLVGGMTLLPGANSEEKSQLYLVVEAIAAPQAD